LLHYVRASAAVEASASVYRPSEGVGRAPVIFSVYGGPGPHMVNDSWVQTVDLRAQMLAQQGFVVLKVDNRGSPRRGLAFEAAIARRMGQIEVRDQVEGVRWLETLGFSDISRVGIYGWSYGGYMAQLRLVRAPGGCLDRVY